MLRFIKLDTHAQSLFELLIEIKRALFHFTWLLRLFLFLKAEGFRFFLLRFLLIAERRTVGLGLEDLAVYA